MNPSNSLADTGCYVQGHAFGGCDERGGRGGKGGGADAGGHALLDEWPATLRISELRSLFIKYVSYLKLLAAMRCRMGGLPP